jgi:methylmalonyl-CoA mutase N-terminal domain/subunit
MIADIERRGGMVHAIESGWAQQQVADAAWAYQCEVERGERVIVGVNRFAEAEEEHVELLRIDPAAERRQLERTARVRAERDAAAAENALAEVRRVAGGGENLLPAMREALRARCTVGEISNVLREEFGTFDASRA